MVGMVDKVEPDMGKKMNYQGIETKITELTSGRHLRRRDGESKHRVGGICIRNVLRRSRHALNLSCEKEELVNAAFWIHCG